MEVPSEAHSPGRSLRSDDEGQPPVGRGWSRAILLGSALLILVQVLAVARNWRFYHYDFRAYYVGPLLLLRGENPYSIEALVAVSRQLGLESNNHPFIYPPHMLVVFLPLALVPYKVAYFFWLTAESLAILAIYRIATTRLQVSGVWLAPLLAVGANGAIAASLRAGQVSIFTTLAIVLGLAALQQSKLQRSFAYVLLASVVKLWPIALAILPAAATRKRGWGVLSLVVSAALFAVPLLVAKVFAPRHWQHFLEAAGAVSRVSREQASGPLDASLLNFLRSLTGALDVPSVATPTYAALGLAVMAIMLRAVWIDHIRSADRNRGTWFCVLGLCLVVPRFPNYEWCLALPGLAYALPRIPSRLVRIASAFLVFVPTLYVNRYALGLEPNVPVSTLLMTCWSFSAFLGLALAWVSLASAYLPGRS